MVAEVAFGTWVGVAPLLGGLAKERHVEQISLARVDELGLDFGDGGGNEGFLDRIGVDAVVDLGQSALQVPAELEAVAFVVLEPTELLDQVDLELGADPHSEFEGDVGMCVGATVASGSGFQPDGIGLGDPFLDADLVAVEACLAFNCGEFAIIKVGIEYRLPDAKELHRVPVAQPVGDEEVAVLGAKHVGEGDVIPVFGGKNRDLRPPHVERVGFGWFTVHTHSAPKCRVLRRAS